jgi:ABC-type amino acid transport substrate-binding protein
VTRCLLASLLLGVAAQAGAAEPLTVCMAADNAPLSHQKNGQAAGLDQRIAQAVADELGRELRVVLFESEYEKESSLTHEVNALLSSGVCDAASGFPLLAGDLGPSARANAKTPDYPGAKRKRERPFVALGSLVASRAYQGVALGVVQAAGAAPVNSLADLRQRRIGSVSGTMSSAMLMGWRNGILRPQLVSLSQRDDALAEVAAGRIDAAVVPLALFDGWRLAHPGAALAAAPWRKPIGINLGFVTLQPQEGVRGAIDRVVTRALADGALARWAAAEGVSWQAPQSPEVSGGIGLAALIAD